MKSFVYIALVVFLGNIAAQGYGPNIHHQNHWGPHRSSNWPSHGFHHGPPHGPHHGPPHGPNHGPPHGPNHGPPHGPNHGPPHGPYHGPPHGPHHGPPHGPHYGPPQGPHHGPPHGPYHHGSPQGPDDRPHDNNFEPHNQHGHWDKFPVWINRSDSRDSSEERGSYDSYRPDGIYGPDDDSRESNSSDHSGPSYEDYGDCHHHDSKHPCKSSPNKKPPQPIPTTPKPIPTTPKIPFATLPPPPAHTPNLTPKPTETTSASRPNSTTPEIFPRPTTTAGPITSPPITTASIPTWYPTTPIEDTTNWETTTYSVPETTSFTTTAEEGLTTTPPEIEKCIALCHSTSEHNNPVCGSDGTTYGNEEQLFCASSCGVNVTLVRRSACPPPNWDNDDGGEMPPPITNTTTPFHRRTASEIQLCMKQCHITASFIPVCGTDLVTYMNMDRLKCAQSCGEVVEVLCEKPCAACGIKPVTPKTITTLRPSTTPQIGETTQEPDVKECINACPVTSEYNPVCGSNHVTYSNPSHFVCAQLCGVGVVIVRFGPCGPTTTSSTTTVTPSPTLLPDVLSCIRRCPVTTEYHPVCGSDDLTYNNLGNLNCLKFCGIDKFDLGPNETDNTPSQTTQEINGNKDHVTTPSLSTTTTTATPTTTPTNSSSTFTINIFESTTTQASRTKPKNPDEDEDIDLDVRFNNEADTYNDAVIFPN